MKTSTKTTNTTKYT